MPGYERNLVLVHTPRFQARSDFEAISAKLAATAPDIEVFVVNNLARQSVTRRQAAGRPTLVFSPLKLRSFQPLRGRIFAGRTHTKLEEVGRLEAGGVRVPGTVMLKPDTVLHPATWGPFTVLKPNKGMQGNGIRLCRTRDVRWVDPRSWPADDPRHGHDLLAQRFIDTGLHTTCHRVMTVFGRPMWATTSRWLAPRTFALDPDGSEPVDNEIAANHGERTVELNYQPDILAFGTTVAAAFPEIPALGTDVVREESTGDLYALEVNAGGFTWHTSSNYGLEFQKKRGIDLSAQFGALDVLAGALIDATRRYAE